MSVNCISCGNVINEIHDTTYSNLKTERAYVGQHTGNIYKCVVCDEKTLDNFLSGETEYYNG